MSIHIARGAKHINMQITVATVKNSSFASKEIQLKGEPLYAHHISKGKFGNTHCGVIDNFYLLWFLRN